MHGGDGGGSHHSGGHTGGFDHHSSHHGGHHHNSGHYDNSYLPDPQGGSRQGLLGSLFAEPGVRRGLRIGGRVLVAQAIFSMIVGVVALVVFIVIAVKVLGSFNDNNSPSLDDPGSLRAPMSVSQLGQP